jgi:hypothetical protein
MMRQDLRVHIDNFRKLLFKRLADAGVHFQSLAAQQGAVRGILHEGMLEQETGLR